MVNYSQDVVGNDGRQEEVKGVIIFLKRKKINLKIVEFQWMFDRCVSMLPLFPFTCRSKANEP